MQAYLQKTMELVRDGMHQEALERLVWFHDHALEHEPSMYGVRLSFAMGYWKMLGEAYPPAMAALKKTRDDKTALLEADTITLLQEPKVNRGLFHDVASFNRTLGEEAKTVALFRNLDRGQPDLAKFCWGVAKDALFREKAYDLARKYMLDPIDELARLTADYEESCSMCGTGNIGEPFKIATEAVFVERTLDLIQVLIALENAKAAKEIQEKALAVLDDERLREAVK